MVISLFLDSEQHLRDYFEKTISSMSLSARNFLCEANRKKVPPMKVIFVS